MRANPPIPSEFLQERNLLKRQPDTFPFHYYYQASGLGAYDKVFVAPVSTRHLRESDGWAALDKKMDGQFGNSVDALSEFMRKAYVQAFEKALPKGRFSVTDRKDQPGTLVIEPAIIAVIPSKAELQAAGVVASALVFPGFGVAASLVSAGSIDVECRICDAKTGKTVAMYADVEKDPSALIPTARFTWTRSCRINIKMIAAMTVKLLSAGDDFKDVRRDFPIRLTALIKDSELDEPDR